MTPKAPATAARDLAAQVAFLTRALNVERPSVR